jgi:hypothetical protein
MKVLAEDHGVEVSWCPRFENAKRGTVSFVEMQASASPT